MRGAVAGVGLALRGATTHYPDEVSRLVEMVSSSTRTAALAESLRSIDVPRKGTLLVRHFALNDDLGNAFRVIHVLKMLGEKVDRETYRYLMYACCKYEDINLGLFVMEQMLHDNRPDFRSFKRLFDACASAVDLRLWVAYDVMMWFYPLKGFGQNSLKTTAFITELMHTLGLRASSRAGRGFVTLPNPRGEPYDPFASMFEDDDPNYDLALEGGEDAKLRRQLIAEEFEDRNRMKEIVARVKARERGVWNESGHLEGLEAGGWGREAVLALLSETERDETARLAMRTAQKEKEAQLEAAPRMTIKEAWRLARKKQ